MIDLNKNENKKEEKRNENNKKFKMKYELTSKIINKLKQEIKKFSYPFYNYNDKRNNSLKNPLLFSNNSRRSDYQCVKKKENSSLRLTKSYYLYNFNSKDKNLKTSSKFHLINDSFTNSNLNTNGIVNLSTKYNNQDKNIFLNERLKFNDKSNDSKNFYKSNYNDKFLPFSKYNTKIKLNFNSTKNHLYINKMRYNHLPKIKQLNKSSSVGNYERIKYGKKSRLTIDNGNNQYKNNLINY